jgi:malonyl-CoA/methylmalonyl-CoA synthetase
VNLTDLFDLSLRARRDLVGLEFQGREFTFGELDDRSNRVAAALAARGLERGDRLCIYLPNCVELIDVYLACVKLGVIFVPINILYRERELNHILGDAEPKAVVSNTEFDSPVPIWRPADLADPAPQPADLPHGGAPQPADLSHGGAPQPADLSHGGAPQPADLSHGGAPQPADLSHGGAPQPADLSHGDAPQPADLPHAPAQRPAEPPRAAGQQPKERSPDSSPAELSPAAAPRPQARLDGDAPAAIIYTSGTTGVAKGAVLTHDNFAANAIGLLTCWQISAADRLLLALPLFHVHALGNGLHCWLLSGCRMRLLERFAHQTAAAEFFDFRPTLFFGVPTIYVRLLDLPADAAAAIGAFMRLFVSGSAALPAHVLEEFRRRFGHTILERYGMSETFMIASNPYVGERRPGSVGLPMPSVGVRLAEGEIQVKGPNVFAGYWRRQDATRAAFTDDGWFRTGDLAERSPDGYITLCGRKSDLIISAGFNIYPREIEEFLEEQPEVAEAAVAGVQDTLRGEVPAAWVVLRAPVHAAELERRCREKLASFKVPRAFRAVERLPRNAMGKIQKHLLADQGETQ